MRCVVYMRDQESSGFNGHKEVGGLLIAVIKISNLACRECTLEDFWASTELCSTPKGTVSHCLDLCVVYIPPPISRPMLKYFLANGNNVMDESDAFTCVVGTLIWVQLTGMELRLKQLTASVA